MEGLIMDIKEKVNQFRQFFLDEVRRKAEATNDITETSFVEVFCKYLADEGIISDFQYAHYERAQKPGRKKSRVDGFSPNVVDETINLLIADFSNNEVSKPLPKNVATQIFSECQEFVQTALNGKYQREIDKSYDDVFNLARGIYFYNERKQLRKIKIFLISDKTSSYSARFIESNKINDIVIEYHIWTIDRLFENLSENGETREIEFKDFGGAPVKCIKIDSGSYPGYMCALPGNLLANLYERLDTELLEGNIRSFLSTKVNVNKGIRRTIVNEPDKFFVYNNGISATATEVYTMKKNEDLFLTGIVNFQIVNGGQTTASLYNSRYKDKADLSSIYVPMKLIVVEKEKAAEVIPLIAEYANTQNKVNAADFFSNHDFCIKMEKCSRECNIEETNGKQYKTYWFFERTKGQYVQAQVGKTSAEIKAFTLKFPKENFFNKTDLAKFRNSWDGLPHIVSKGAQTNFQYFSELIKRDYDKKADNYNSLYYKETVALGILFHKIEALVSEQPWYQKGYRAQIVTYSIALFSKLFAKQYPKYCINLLDIWKKQSIPNEILRVFIDITKIVNDIINDPSRSQINVTQWCKKEECWKQVQDKNGYVINSSILNCCITKDQKTSALKEAKKSTEVDKGINYQFEAVNYGKENFARLYDFVKERKWPLYDDLIRALNVAVIMSGNKIPNSYQSKILIKLREDAAQEGFKLYL